MNSSLLVSDRIRATIKRMFGGTHAEVFAELLQNAQRIKATEVAFRLTRTDSVTLHYQDNGPGLGTAEAYFRLLALGATGYDAATEQSQNPMGFGFNSLLAHEDVAQVTVRSGGFELVLDAPRWWEDAAYAESWRDRLTPLSTAPGLQLEIAYRPGAGAGHWRPLEDVLEAELKSQAAGYFGYFGVTLNGAALPQGEHAAIDPHQGTVSWHLDGTLSSGTPYRWVLFKNYETYNCFVRWYGQHVSDRLSDSIPANWGLYLDVTHGQPIDLLAPTRKTVIRNQKLEAVLTEARTALFDALNALEDPLPRQVSTLKELNLTRFEHESRFGLVRAWKADQLPALSTAHRDRVEDLTVVKQADLQAQLAANTFFKLDNEVGLLNFYGRRDWQHTGIGSFLPYAPAGLTLVCEALVPEHWGEVPVLQCCWKPGCLAEKQPAAAFTLHDPGQVAWVRDDVDELTEALFKRLPDDAHVYAGSGGSSLEETDVQVGTRNFEAFMDQYQGAWLCGDEAEKQALDKAFWDLRRSFKGDAIPTAFTLQDFDRFLEPDEFVLSLKLTYSRLKQPVARPAASGVTATTSLGRKLKFSFYA